MPVWIFAEKGQRKLNFPPGINQISCYLNFAPLTISSYWQYNSCNLHIGAIRMIVIAAQLIPKLDKTEMSRSVRQCPPFQAQHFTPDATAEHYPGRIRVTQLHPLLSPVYSIWHNPSLFSLNTEIQPVHKLLWKSLFSWGPYRRA